jgi:hypothetical protein
MFKVQSTKLISSVVATLAALFLSGCFISEQPKLDLATAAAPFGEGGRYGVFERGEGDHYRRQETFVIKRRPDGAYDFTNEKGEAIVISFHPMGGDRFLSQAKAEKDQPGYGYAVLRVAGKEAFLYAPQCSDQDRPKVEALGVEINGQFECDIGRVKDVIGLFGFVDIGQPVSKLARE